MKVIFHLTVFLLLCFISHPEKSIAQSIPVGTVVLEDAYRRAQLLGEIDSSISFTSRPLFPVASMKIDNPFDPFSTLGKERWTKTGGIFQFLKDRGTVQLLPFTLQHQYNSDHPYSLNDGMMISFTKYDSEKDSSFKTLFPIFYPLQRKNNYDNPARPVAGDQRASAFIRWLFVPENAEVYLEIMREDKPN